MTLPWTVFSMPWPRCISPTQEQGLDYETILKFFWKTYIANAASHTGDLVL